MSRACACSAASAVSRPTSACKASTSSLNALTPPPAASSTVRDRLVGGPPGGERSRRLVPDAAVSPAAAATDPRALGGKSGRNRGGAGSAGGAKGAPGGRRTAATVTNVDFATARKADGGGAVAGWRGPTAAADLDVAAVTPVAETAAVARADVAASAPRRAALEEPAAETDVALAAAAVEEDPAPETLTGPVVPRGPRVAATVSRRTHSSSPHTRFRDCASPGRGGIDSTARSSSNLLMGSTIGRKRRRQLSTSRSGSPVTQLRNPATKHGERCAPFLQNTKMLWPGEVLM